jgi:hypothetical protein
VARSAARRRQAADARAAATRGSSTCGGAQASARNARRSLSSPQGHVHHQLRQVSAARPGHSVRVKRSCSQRGSSWLAVARAHAHASCVLSLYSGFHTPASSPMGLENPVLRWNAAGPSGADWRERRAVAEHANPPASERPSAWKVTGASGTGTDGGLMSSLRSPRGRRPVDVAGGRASVIRLPAMRARCAPTAGGSGGGFFALFSASRTLRVRPYQRRGAAGAFGAHSSAAWAALARSRGGRFCVALAITSDVATAAPRAHIHQNGRRASIGALRPAAPWWGTKELLATDWGAGSACARGGGASAAARSSAQLPARGHRGTVGLGPGGAGSDRPMSVRGTRPGCDSCCAIENDREEESG